MKQILRNKWALVLMVTIPVIITALAITITSVFGGLPFKFPSLTPPKQAITLTPVTEELGIDSGLFNKEGCKAPCWHDLTPGQSTSQDVDNFLVALPKTQWSERYNDEYNTGCKSIRLVEPGIGIVDLYVVDDNLTYIQPFYPNDIRLGEIVNFFGDPEYFKAVLYIGFDYSVYTLEIYYPQKGLAFEISTDQEKDLGMSEGDILKNLPGQEKISGKVGADMVVSAVHYFESGDLSSYYLSMYSCYLNKADAILRGQTETKFTQKWHGFGEMDVMIDSELQIE